MIKKGLFLSVIGIFSIFLGACPLFSAETNYQGEFSVAGFFEGEDSPRQVYDFNLGWKFFLGNRDGAQNPDFDDTNWEAVVVPHGLEILPLNASGGVNYQGPAWYRKKFELPAAVKGKQLFLHFEAIMGRSIIYVNGKKVTEFFGGYLPIHLDVTDFLSEGENCVAVFADNSDDISYPPGKDQGTLDFAYFGGIYRDTYLIATERVFITDATASNKEAGGGVFLHYENWTDLGADLIIQTEVANNSGSKKELIIEGTLIAPDGTSYPVKRESLVVNSKKERTATLKIEVSSDFLWTPNTPHLHRLTLTVKEEGRVLDSVALKTGVRKIEFRGKEGFFLNGKPYNDKLIGGNRHQDYAYIGNALPNSGQWRDAQKMREAGMRIVRAAHYPMDPAFMNACDELGLFVIVATPGWQFWNPASKFEKYVLSDIRNMVRRDRNHASVLLWEPILNETWYPSNFARKAYKATHEEYPFQGCYAACDESARGSKIFDIIYEHPFNSDMYEETLEFSNATTKKLEKNYRKFDRPIFNREWGDNVDDWNSHNSPSRAALGWGEGPQLTQLFNYSTPHYPYSTYHTQFLTPPQHFGATLWHTFDHQRGYHPDPFWGGIFDAFRQPKYSFYLFKSQMEPDITISRVPSGPFIKIVHELSPFSGEDITIVSNCDEVRLTVFGKKYPAQPTKDSDYQMPHKPITFKNVYNFMELKQLFRENKHSRAHIVAEGLIDGKVVASEKKFPSVRLEQIKLAVDYSQMVFTGDGNDIIPIVATLCDKKGNIRRYSDEYIRFTITGPGKILGDAEIGANPVKAEWGQAVALVQSTGGEGEITLYAELLRFGKHEPGPAIIKIQPKKPRLPQLFSEKYAKSASGSMVKLDFGVNEEVKKLQMENARLQRELNAVKLQEVEKQQSDFEGNP